jgi:DNA replication licensing factor MCM4
MRSLGNSKKTITATPRQLESTIRLSEAIAKMRLSETIEKRDIDEAVRLIKTAMQQSATDPTTGEIDMNIINTGVS